MVGEFSQVQNLPPDFTEQVFGSSLVMNVHSVYETAVFEKKRENEGKSQFSRMKLQTEFQKLWKVFSSYPGSFGAARVPVI